MNPREVVLEAFKLGIPERVPVAFFGAGVWTIFNSGNTFSSFIGEPEKYADTLVKYSKILQSDIVYCGSGYNNFLAAAIGGKIKIRQVGAPDLEAPLINSPEDLDRLSSEALENDKLVATIHKATRLVAERIGSEYLVTTTSWGPFTLGAQLRGVEALMRDVYKNQEFAKRVVAFATSMILKFFEPLVEDSTLSTITIADPTASGDLISKKHFGIFALPYLQKVTSHMRARGVNTLLHICGNTTDKLDFIGETGATCFSLDHKVDIALAKQTFRSRMCIAGNVNPVHVLSDKKPEEVRTAALECIKKASEGGGYILMAGCDHPASVPLDNIKAFIGAAKKYA